MVETSVSLGRTPDGRRLEVAARLAAPPAAAWDALIDTERWPAWGPSVTDVDCEDHRVRAGSAGRVRLPGGVWVPFRVTHLANRRWTWRVARVPATGHRVESVDGNATGGEEDSASDDDASGDDASGDDASGDDASGDDDAGEGQACRVVFEVPPLAAGYVPVCRRALGDLATLLDG